jgi:WD40 repeat protein
MPPTTRPTRFFSNNGDRLATAEPDGTIRVWDSTTYQELQHLRRPRKTISNMAFSPDGRRLLFAETAENWAVTLRLWILQPNRVKTVTGQFPTPVVQVAFSPDGQKAWTSSGWMNHARSLGHWDLNTGQRLSEFEVPGPTEEVGRFVLSRDGRHLFFGTRDVWRWDVTEPKSQPYRLEKRHLSPETNLHGMALTDKGMILATSASDRMLILMTAAGRAVLWDWKTGFPYAPGVLAFSPDGNRLAVANTHSAVYILDVSAILAENREK